MAIPRPLRSIITLLVLFAVLFAGWSWLWHFAAGETQAAIAGWHAREAKAGRVYDCGAQTVTGYPFGIEVDCAHALAVFRSNHQPLEVKAAGIHIAAQVYQPTSLTTDIKGPVTVAEPGQGPSFIADWTLARTSVGGTPVAPERASLVFYDAAVNRVSGNLQLNYLRAKRIEIHGRIVEGSAKSNPVIEVVLRLASASAPGIHPAAAVPVDADVTWVLRGLSDFSPKSWPDRLRQLQAANGRIEITQARVQQGPTLAVGKGTLSLTANGRLNGELRITIAGLEPFLAAIGAQQAVQKSPDMDKVAGALDRLLPGLGNVAREQAGANLSVGISLLGQQTSLEGKRAVMLPLRFDDGAIYLGPIKIGNAPALF